TALNDPSFTNDADLEEVVHDPDRIEPSLVGGACDPRQALSELLRSSRRRGVVDLQADLHRCARAIVLGDLETIREILAHLLDLRRGVVDDVRLRWVSGGVVLVVVLTWVEAI